MPARLLSDERLAREVGSGHESAFTALFNRYHQQLYRYCRSLTGSDQDAQDALQSTFANALIALRAGRRNAPLRPWLYRIAHNESISLVRSRRPTLEVPEELESTADVHESVEQRERLTMLVADLQELPERQRGALVMRELGGLTHDEIAQALEVSVGAAKQTILEARRSLLEFAEGRAMGCEEVLAPTNTAPAAQLNC
jgi:RNA polymerase sigma factor (sigma-70 family)